MSEIKLLIAASEALPFAATGGLADVIGSLPPALSKIGIDVRVVIPLYSSISAENRAKMTFVKAINVKLAWRNQHCGIFMAEHNNVKFYFIDNEYYFKRASMYGDSDDGERYAFFCKAVLEMLPHIEFFPDIIHSNDWHTALIPVYLKRLYNKTPGYSGIKSIHTLHNIEYQGEFSFDLLEDVFELSQKEHMLMDYKGKVNLTKGAVICCDKFTTVSPTYAEEIKTEMYSHGLHYILNMYLGKITGILNGIDTDYYKPVNFSADDLSGKYEEKAALQLEQGLPVNPDTPMISMITRLVVHKGMDLVVHVIEELLEQEDVQFVLLGTGEQKYEDFFKHIAGKYPDKVKAIISFDSDLAKRLYSASDIFLMPSKSEPCGLAQMISSQYGTVPFVREVGGLYDSIKDMENGFTFSNFNAHDMLFKLKFILAMYKNDKTAWNALVNRVMAVDFSWSVSAEKYKNLYKELIN